MQRVVFNANYLAYCDDAADWWFRSLGARLEAGDVGRDGEEGHRHLGRRRPGRTTTSPSRCR